MFPKLRGFTSPSNQELADLAQGQLDPDQRSTAGDTATLSGYTYLGQFIDHDLVMDTSPSPTRSVDPRTLVNGRTFRFDLDSVYGGGPEVSPQLYDVDRVHFLVANPSANGVRDLPRTMGGGAILVEGRNDENEIISQLHVAFLLFHNRLIDDGASFAAAQKQTILCYQWVVLHDFLPKIVGPDVVTATRAGKIRRFYDPGHSSNPMTPVEWSVAAYRFGHSMVRFDYKLNDDTEDQPGDELITVFDRDGGNDLHGGRALPANRQILWGYFFRELTDTDDIPLLNYARLIDPLIAEPLYLLPIPGAEASGSNVLAYRNLIRGKFYGLPSGQDVARAMGIEPINAGRFGLGDGFTRSTPLWYYILAESASVNDGQILGPVGGRIVADVFVKLLEIDRNSILNTRFTPTAPVATTPGQLTISDMLLYAGVAPPPVL